MTVTGDVYVVVSHGEWEVSLGLHGWSRRRYREHGKHQTLNTWECGPLMVTRVVRAHA